MKILRLPCSPAEDLFLIEWFGGVIHCYYSHHFTKLAEYQNHSINLHFKQYDDYQNQIEFNNFARAVLTTQKFIFEYIRVSRGFLQRAEIPKKERL